MRAYDRMRVLLAAIVVACLPVAAALAQGAEAPAAGAEWPCEQPLRPEMSIGAMWPGPDPSASGRDWREIPAIVALVDEIAPRRVPQEQAEEHIRRFAAGYQGAERGEMLTQLFAGLFDTLSAERDAIIRGIKRFYRRQDVLARRIEEDWKALGEIEPGTTDPQLAVRRAALQQQVEWEGRIFDDRQHLLPMVCEQPRVLEQRVFALSRVIQQQLPATQ